MLEPCSATVAERRFDGGGTMSDDQIHEEQQRLAEIDSLMREDASVLRETLGDAFNDLWTELHGVLTAANEPGRTWDQAQASRAAAACCVLNSYIDLAVGIRSARNRRLWGE
jgi:hypothetical protein